MRNLADVPLESAVTEALRAAEGLHRRKDLLVYQREAELTDIQKKLMARIRQAGPIYD